MMKRFAPARRVASEEDRQKALSVLRTIYEEEKAWVEASASLFPPEDLTREDVSWFLAQRRGRPVGVMRVNYAPALDTYMAYGLTPLAEGLDVNALLAGQKLAEIGRFAVMPDVRASVLVSSALIRAAVRDVVGRECTLIVTDVFENERHSPLGFHTRVVGFRPVATHETGELRHKGRRVTLVLDLKEAYQRLKLRSNWFFRQLTQGWTEAMHRKLA